MSLCFQFKKMFQLYKSTLQSRQVLVSLGKYELFFQQIYMVPDFTELKVYVQSVKDKNTHNLNTTS